jgi:two-component system, NarL family, invasion response regulator UvrY
MTIRVLLVDDHAIVRDALCQVLATDPGLEVIGTASDGASALRLTRKFQPDLVLLDIVLPDGSGLDLIASLQLEHLNARVLMLSMHAEPEYVAAALKRGAHGLVPKSSSPQAFLQAVHDVASDRKLHEDPMPWTQREQDVLALLSQGHSNQEIAERLRLSPKTIDGHLQRMMSRSGLHTRVGLIRYAQRSMPAVKRSN